MAQLYIDEYARTLAGRRVCIACREGVLRDHLKEIVHDIKFLSRFKVNTTLFHNLPNRFANQKLLHGLEKKLPATTLVRISPEADFYAEVLEHPDTVYKLIFLERRPLVDNKGYRINTLTTGRVRESLADFSDLIANVNFKDAMNRICETIEAGTCERIHILPAGKNSIKHELFTVEGSGTMIANNFVEEFRQVCTDDEVAIVSRILAMYKRSGYLRPRSKAYVSKHRHSFYVTAIDTIVVGCVERKIIDDQTIELGALAISTRFRNQRIGVYMVSSFLKTMADMGYCKFLVMTNNPRLQELLLQLGFSQQNRVEYKTRQEASPGVAMFYLEAKNTELRIGNITS